MSPPANHDRAPSSYRFDKGQPIAGLNKTQIATHESCQPNRPPKTAKVSESPAGFCVRRNRFRCFRFSWQRRTRSRTNSCANNPGSARNPRPPGCWKLVGSANDWRIRVGDYRIVYEIADTAREARVNRVHHRLPVYRSFFKSIQDGSAPGAMPGCITSSASPAAHRPCGSSSSETCPSSSSSAASGRTCSAWC